MSSNIVWRNLSDGSIQPVEVPSQDAHLMQVVELVERVCQCDAVSAWNMLQDFCGSYGYTRTCEVFGVSYPFVWWTFEMIGQLVVWLVK